MVHNDVVVIGGGASGMFAAACAAERGLRVLLLERNERLGRKLGITGNGRCNLTNADAPADFIRRFGKNGRFLYRALAELSSRDLRAFFRERGVETREEAGGRVFPASGSSESVVRALERCLRERGVTIRLKCRVKRIVTDPAASAVSGVEVADGGEIVASDRIILATGGLSYPATGSTGDGYAMAERLGHTIIPPKPALIPLETEERFPGAIKGLSLHDVEVAALAGVRKIASESGDMLFTHFGVSGPVILALSARIVERLERYEKVAISVNLKPGLDAPELDRLLIRELGGSGRRSIGTVMRGMMPRALVPVFMKSLGISADTKCGQITLGERKRLAGRLADFRIAIKRPRPIAEAIITRGGIDVDEINPRTMESKKVKGLFFCGEVIDIDGASGGYNLQAAFSTGYLAGKSV